MGDNINKSDVVVSIEIRESIHSKTENENADAVHTIRADAQENVICKLSETLSDKTEETTNFPFPIDASLILTHAVVEHEDNNEFSLRVDIDTCDRLLEQEITYDS